MGIYSSCKALVIGVSHYADPQFDLGYARSDAEALAGLLGKEFGFDKIWTLYDSDATRQGIIRFFEQNLQHTDEDDGLLIFFAGHGITVTSAIGDDRGFLVPHDGNPKEPYANISLTTIRDDYLPMIPAKHVFLIVDACYGGLALRDVATIERPQTIDDTVLAELTHRDRKVRQVLAAGGKDQRVLDGGLFGHSVFTGRLIEALREANPYITADHVGVHVRERVARDGADRHHRQTPRFGYLYGGDGTFVFCRSACRVHRPERVDLLKREALSNLCEIVQAPIQRLLFQIAYLSRAKSVFSPRIETQTKTRTLQLQQKSFEGLQRQLIDTQSQRQFIKNQVVQKVDSSNNQLVSNDPKFTCPACNTVASTKNARFCMKCKRFVHNDCAIKKCDLNNRGPLELFPRFRVWRCPICMQVLNK